jgi:CMD domain protein
LDESAIMTDLDTDVIDGLVGIAKSSRLDAIRDQRPDARENAQKSYRALFAPAVAGGVGLASRFAVALFVAELHREASAISHYQAGYAAHGGRNEVAQAIALEARRGAAQGPYGRYPQGPLSIEDNAGPVYRVDPQYHPLFGARLSAALEHAHLLVFRPREASPEALQSLLDAGWTTDDVVTLSQLVAFLSFQLRVIVGLRALAATAATGA